MLNVSSNCSPASYSRTKFSSDRLVIISNLLSENVFIFLLIIITRSDYQRLMIVGECITALLFPFTWPHVYAPILPASLHHFLDAPVPFVMGLHADSADGNLKIGSEATLCYVDIDKKSIQMPEEMPVFPHRTDVMIELTAALDKFNVPRGDGRIGDLLLTGGGSSIMNQKNGTSSGSYLNHHLQHANQRHVGGDSDVMTSSCTLPSGHLQVRRKHSLHDVLDWDRPNSPDLGYGGGGAAPTAASTTTPLRSDALHRIVDHVRRTGAGADDVDGEVMPSHTRKGPTTASEQYCEDLRLNNSIREIFLNRFVQMFATYENFVILPNQVKEEWLSNRESLQNFDKASFLSDQQQHHRPFLSQFLESQMFATLIDNKIMSVWDGDFDPNLRLFDNRIKILRLVSIKMVFSRVME